MYLYNSPIKSLGKLKRIGRDLHLSRNETIRDLGELEHVGSININETNIKSLGKLKVIGGRLYARNSQLEDLAGVTHIGGVVDFAGTNITNLGNVTHIGGELKLEGTKITSLSKLKSLGGDLNAPRSNLEDLGNLEWVGGHVRIQGSNVTTLGNLKNVDGHVEATGSKLKDLGKLETVYGSVELSRTKVKDTGNLRIVLGTLSLPDGGTNAKALEHSGEIDGGKPNFNRLSRTFTFDETQEKRTLVGMKHRLIKNENQKAIDDAVAASAGIRFRDTSAPEFLAPVDKLSKRLESDQKAGQTLKDNVLLANPKKDYGSYGKYEIVPVIDPVINIHNLNSSIYGLGFRASTFE